MARTITEIYDALALEKSQQSTLSDLAPDIDVAQDLLSDLDSPSKVARWRLMLWVVAVSQWTLEKLWDLFKAEVDAAVAAGHIGTPPWYVKMALAFQYGYALTYDTVTGAYGYASVDTAALIVKRAAIAQSGSLVILKVAKLVSDSPAPLTTTEKNAFLAYMGDIGMAGVMINVISDDPDRLHITYTIYYDPLVLSPTGALLSDASVYPVEDAINAYISNLPFNGRLVMTYLDDAIQQVPGVRFPQLGLTQAAYGAFALITVTQYYTAHSGYMVIDPAYPLATTIQYIPYVD